MLTKTKRKNSFATKVCTGFNILLPEFMMNTWIFRVNNEIVLTLEDNVVTFNRGKITHFYSPSIQDKLIAKIGRELLDIREMKKWKSCESLIEDIAAFLILEKWDDTVMNSLLEKPDLLKKLVTKFRSDGECNELFERTLRNLVLKQALESNED